VYTGDMKYLVIGVIVLLFAVWYYYKYYSYVPISFSFDDGTTTTLSCPAGQNIHLISSMYGNPKSGNCTPVNVTAPLSTLVNGKPSYSDPGVWKNIPDPCYGTAKTLTGSYYCR
jgi:hypothetical protein